MLPALRGGGWYSPVDIPLLQAVIKERPDRTTEELTRAYNERAAPEAQVHRSSVLRALQRTGYVFKKRPRPAEQDGPIVQAERLAFQAWLGPRRCAPLGLSRRIGRKSGDGALARVGAPRQCAGRAAPTELGDNLTLVGAMRVDRWLTRTTAWGAMTTPRCIEWAQRRLVLRLRRGDIVGLDNLAAHKARRGRTLVEQAGATLHFLPPYSHDFNPIEAAWALIKKRIRAIAPRTGAAPASHRAACNSRGTPAGL